LYRLFFSAFQLGHTEREIGVAKDVIILSSLAFHGENIAKPIPPIRP